MEIIRTFAYEMRKKTEFDVFLCSIGNQFFRKWFCEEKKVLKMKIKPLRFIDICMRNYFYLESKEKKNSHS